MQSGSKWKQTSLTELKNWKHERIARELAVGKTPEEASAVLDDDGKPLYDPAASSFANNARKRAAMPEMVRRVAELRAPGIRAAERRVAAAVAGNAREVQAAEHGIAVTVEWLLRRLMDIAEFNIDDYMTPPDPVTGERRIDISAVPRHLLGRLGEVAQEVDEGECGFRVRRTRIKNDKMAALQLIAKITGAAKEEGRDGAAAGLAERLDRARARVAGHVILEHQEKAECPPSTSI